jgi:sialate O-acetylesterase
VASRSPFFDDWRSKFNAASYGITPAQFPFGIVQLAPWSMAGHDNNDGCMQSMDCEVAQLRWGQTANVGTSVNNSLLPNTFIAVTTDVGDFDSPYGSIHPRQKIPLGDRLALAGRSVAYSEPEIYWTGPISPVATAQAGKGLRVQFRSCAPGGIQLHETAGFDVQSAGMWKAVAVAASVAAQAACAVDLDPTSEGATMVRYNWYRSTCFANETKKALGRASWSVSKPLSERRGPSFVLFFWSRFLFIPERQDFPMFRRLTCLVVICKSRTRAYAFP